MEGIPGCIFGPPLWTSLHLMSFAYPEQTNDKQLKQNVYNFFKNLGAMLPCTSCRDHFNKNFDNVDLMKNLDGRENFSRWVYMLHDTVNKQLGKKSPPFEEIKAKYMKLKNENTTCDNHCSDKSDYECRVEIINKNEGFSNYGNMDNKTIGGVVIVMAVVFGIGFYYYNRGQKGTKTRR